MSGAEEHVLGELRPGQLQADRQALGEPAGNREPGQPGHVGRDREEVGGVHRERILRLLAQLEGDRRRGRADDQVEALEQRRVLAGDDRAHLLRLAVEGVVVAGRERVGADHDPALGLVAEALVAGALVHLDQALRVLGAVAVADAVVAGQVRGGLGRGDQVVAGESVLDRERQRALLDLGAELLCRARSPARSRP